MFTMRDVLVEEERRLDKMRNAEYARFVHQVTPVNKFKCLLCIRLGNILARAGRQLQTRYATPRYRTVAYDLQMESY
jgi:hypothetical protein